MTTPTLEEDGSAADPSGDAELVWRLDLYIAQYPGETSEDIEILLRLARDRLSALRQENAELREWHEPYEQRLIAERDALRRENAELRRERDAIFAETRERCAKECEEYAKAQTDLDVSFYEGKHVGALDCANYCRALQCVRTEGR